MKKSFVVAFIFVYGCFLSQNNYQYFVDLVNVKDKRVKVELLPPNFDKDTVTFCFPAVVPGTYEQYDFGRFIQDLKVYPKENTTIQMKKKDVNCYTIYPAKNLKKIEYYVTDTWNTKIKEKVVFEPAGTNIVPDSVFVINNFGFFGYFRSMDRLPFVVNYTKPVNFYPSSAISTFTLSKFNDVIQYSNYHELADFPVIYSVPDTTILQIHNAQILISCYSPNKKITSSYLASTLKDLLFALSNFFEGKLPVDKYAFLFYFTDKSTLSGSSGALEHNQSSLYVLPELDSIFLSQTIRDVASHEFLHILTPLTIHSEQIEYFDFNNPKMSKHLWLYEGTTEYHAHYLQEKEGLISPDEFINVMLDKIHNADGFNDTMSFTKMSENVLLPYYHSNYNNVYEKGALIGMCLDILLLKESKGEYNLRKLLLDLSKKYGKSKPFKDDSLFDEIEKMTYPSIGNFLRKYVQGKNPLPLAEIFNYVGLKFEKEKTTEEITFGGIDVKVNEKDQIYISSIDNLDAFGKQFGFKENDIIYAFNNRLFTLETAEDILSEFAQTAKEGDLVTFEVIRTNKKGESKNIVLKGKVKKVKQTRRNTLDVVDNFSEEQTFLLKKWLGNE
ncbi:MAG TPA: peptidase M61 [Bacteroidia bacterium]|nr:peptidase M61 [Bacteroidia bacterium]